VDDVVSVGVLPEVVDRALTILAPASAPPVTTRPEPAAATGEPAWQSVCSSRRPDRPGVRELLEHSADEVLQLNGTGQGEADPGLLLALARFGGSPCVLLGQDRRGQTPQAPLGPGALRQARRGMRLAADLDIPLVTVIDTAGAALSRDAEQGGLAGEIARCIADLLALPVPTISLLLGQGTGGGALALVPADRILAAQHGWLSPLPPEGASAILYHDTRHAALMADTQGVRAHDLAADGAVDHIIPECPDAAAEPVAFSRRVGAALRHELGELTRADTATRLAARTRRFDEIGQHRTLLAEVG
jgi:acyl-CoA carboxylase subunit beta